MNERLHRWAPALVLIGWLAATNHADAQARDESEERYRRLSARIEELVASQALQQQQIAGLERGLRELSDQISRNNVNAATQESLRRLGEQIHKVDEARVADNKRVFDAMDELHKALKSAASTPPPRPAPSRSSTSSDGSANMEGYEYVVQKNDTLSGIVQAYRLNNIKVTAKAVMDANPNVKWEALKVGQKIFIPKPKP
jgi:septal ring factor EnvC (AmiA/AmiB activator)